MGIDIFKNQVTIFDVLTERNFEEEEKKKEEYENEVLTLKKYVPTWDGSKYISQLTEIKVSRKELRFKTVYDYKKDCDRMCKLLN